MRAVYFIVFVLCFAGVHAQRVSSTHFFYFESSAENLSEKELGKLVLLCDTLKHHKLISVTVTGHTDDSGDMEMNLELSEKRAASVKAILIQQNLDENIISIIALGETNPVASNNTEKNKAKNRRVEVMIVWE